MLNFKSFLSLSLLGVATIKSLALPLNSIEIKNAQCKDTFELLEKCTSLIEENKEGVQPCEIFDSTECQKFYGNIEDELNNCQFENDKDSVNYIKEFINIYKNICVKDEQGNYCPLASIYSNNNLEEISDEKSDFDVIANIYQQNCISELCREATINFIEVNRISLIEENRKIENNDDDLVKAINDLEDLKNTLRTKECKDSANQIIASKESSITSTATFVQSSTIIKPTVTTSILPFVASPSPKSVVSQEPITSTEPAKKKKCYVKAKKI